MWGREQFKEAPWGEKLCPSLFLVPGSIRHTEASQVMFKGWPRKACHLPITVSITYSTLSTTIIHISTSNFKSHFTQTSVSLVAESCLAVLHSSRISGVNTFSMNLKVVFIKDPPRSYSNIPGTLLSTCTTTWHFSGLVNTAAQVGHGSSAAWTSP